MTDAIFWTSIGAVLGFLLCMGINWVGKRNSKKECD